MMSKQELKRIHVIRQEIDKMLAQQAATKYLEFLLFMATPTSSQYWE